MEKQAPPPAYSTSSLTTSSHGVTLSIPSISYQPGSNVPITITAPQSSFASFVGDAICTLEGMSSVTLMGKMRYQAGQLTNIGFGGGAAYPITSREEHVFASTSTSINLTPSKEKTSGGDAVLQAGLDIPAERSCSCDGPRTSGILPSVPLVEENVIERSGVSWTLAVVIKRKGLTKRDINDAILTNSSTHATKFTSPTPPVCTVSLAVFPPTASRPLSIPFRIHVATTPSPSIVTASDVHPHGKLKVTFSLTRNTWTKGIKQSGFGDPGGYAWPGVHTRSVSPAVLQGGGRDGVEFEGVYDLAEQEKTVDGCGLSIHWTCHAIVQWDHLSRPVGVSIPINLPPAVAQG
ncbi:hypothetical protein CI109_102029 [Kwoniella shandongensis]|uniref:Uncharacterized protein n=1 Tax=Kwoniella shandongensis TaxID=1734106 RepID=A0AAJ8MVV0_9TREE